MSNTFRISILGSSAATPTSLRHTTAQYLQYRNKRFLLDCSEGCQMQLRRFKLASMGINHIFISHLHGDHYLGLAGLLFSYHLSGRKNELHIYSPPGLQQIIELQMETSGLRPVYNTHFHVVKNGSQLLYEDNYLTVESIEMLHRIPCYGFLFKEKKRSVSQPHSYAFCSDTAYTEQYVEQIRGADLLYHEATFLSDMAETARQKGHCTTRDAATVAYKAGVKQLMVGHYSARYKDLELFINEAKEIFPDTFLAEEGMSITIGKRE